MLQPLSILNPNKVHATPEHLARLDAALAQIESAPEKWNQRTWFKDVAPGARDRVEHGEFVPWTCGQQACLAGHLIVNAGAKPVLEVDDECDDDDCTECRHDGVATASKCVTATGVKVDIPYYAAELIGLEVWEADHHLFEAYTTLDYMKRVRTEIARLIDERHQHGGAK